MQIPRSLLDDLSNQLNVLSDSARQMVANLLANATWETEDELRQLVSQAMLDIAEELTDQAASHAAGFYDAVREQAAGQSLGAAPASGWVPEAAYRASQVFVQKYLKHGSVDRLAREMGDRLECDIKRAAGSAVAASGAADGVKVEYASVPSGSETCSFCLMLAAYGPRADTEAAAAHTHAHCDCRIVPFFDGMTVEGYDYAGMSERLDRCLETLGGRDGIGQRWKALPAEERRAYVDKHGGKEGEAFDAYYSRELSKEIGTRDPEWFRTGKPSAITVMEGAKPSSDELSAANLLAENGFPSTFRPTRDKEFLKTSDVYFEVRNSRREWDFKCPKGNGSQTLFHQFEEAAGQSHRIVIDLRGTPAGRHDDVDYVISKVSKVIRYRYKIRTGKGKGNDWIFSESLIVLKNGSIKRITR